MIEEQFVSFDTARMLKDAGFEANLKTMYVEEEKDEWAFWDSGAKRSDYNYFDDTIACPTQDLAARWLREVHHYAVCIWFTKDHEKWFYAYGNMDRIVFDTDYNISEYKYDSYEAALEEGLQEVLKLIIKNKRNEQRSDRKRR